jgi:Soluble NSF attachment protein, SNAP
VAFFSAEAGDYGTAIGIFEEVAAAAADNNLLKFSARGHLLNAGICHLAGVLTLVRGAMLADHAAQESVQLPEAGRRYTSCHGVTLACGALDVPLVLALLGGNGCSGLAAGRAVLLQSSRPFVSNKSKPMCTIPRVSNRFQTRHMWSLQRAQTAL